MKSDFYHFDIIPGVNHPCTDCFIATGCLDTAIVYVAWWPLLQLSSWYQLRLVKSLQIISRPVLDLHMSYLTQLMVDDWCHMET